MSRLYSCSDRQIELQNQISEATTSHQEKLLEILRAQWVHRYGIETLPQGPSSMKDNLDNRCELNESEQDLSTNANQEDDLLKVSSGLNSSIETSQDLTKNKSSENAMKNENVTSSFTKEENLYLLKTPPPTPSLSHLRKWLPAHNIETKKAS